MKLRFWYTVYGVNDIRPTASDLLQAIRPQVRDLTVDFDAASNWQSTGQLRLSPTNTPVALLRRTTTAESEQFQSVLHYLENSLEQGDLQAEKVFASLRQATQQFYITPMPVDVSPSKAARICEQLSGYLCRESNGIIQVYQDGFFSADGESLLPRCPSHRLKTS